MNYEKEYKKLKADIKKAYLFAQTNSTKAVLENILPELRESEDEKVRKELIIHCRNTRCVTEEGAERIAKWIAWLEKQSQFFTKKDVDDAYLKGINDAKKELEKQSGNNIKWNKNTKDNKPQVNHSVLMQTINGIAEGEWQGEQWHQYRWAGIVRDSDVLSWIELSDIEKQRESQNEVRYWTEEEIEPIISDYLIGCNSDDEILLFKECMEGG